MALQASACFILNTYKDVPESITNEEVIKRIEEDGIQAVDIVLKKLK